MHQLKQLNVNQENGVFQALHRNILEAVQITVLADKNKPSHVLETYTFTFSYSGTPSLDKRLASISLDANGSQTEIKTLRSARSGIEMIVRRLITLSSFLPRLPSKCHRVLHAVCMHAIEQSWVLCACCVPGNAARPPITYSLSPITHHHPVRPQQARANASPTRRQRGLGPGPQLTSHRTGERFMEIHLFYNDSCPADYSPPGFHSASDDADRPLMYPETEHWTTETQTCGALDTGPHAVGLKVTSLKWRGGAANDTTMSASATQAEVPREAKHYKAIPRHQDIGIDVLDNHGTPCTAAAAGTPQVMSSQLSTQGRQDQRTKRVLQEMVMPSTPASDIVPTQVKAEDLPTMIADDEEDTQPLRAEISQAKLGKLRKAHGEIAPLKGIVGTDAAAVSCQCGWAGKEEKMLRCHFCTTLQHPICYGFLHGADPSIPAVHACYRCLLTPEGEAGQRTFRELSTLVMLRLALKIIVERGYPNRISEFAGLLRRETDCNGHTIVQITDILRKQGFLVATPGSKSKGFLSKGLPKFRIPFCAKMRERLRREVFNPLALIEHH
ncbi:DNA binding protein, partial [Ascosphaera atra]